MAAFADLPSGIRHVLIVTATSANLHCGQFCMHLRATSFCSGLQSGAPVGGGGGAHVALIVDMADRPDSVHVPSTVAILSFTFSHV
jgi:hypothetical protein